MTPNDDPLLRAFDRLVEAVYWSEDDITLVDALGEAIDDWVALTAAEFNESKPFDANGGSTRLTQAISTFEAAAELASADDLSKNTEAALVQALADWITGFGRG